MNRMKQYLPAAALLGVAALTATGLAVAQPQQHAKPMQCFYSNEWSSWKAPNEHVMYVRVSGNRIYQLDFASSCRMMTEPDAHLITKFEGSNSICTPLDIDLKVADTGGIPEPCIVSGLSQLTPDQIAQIPKKDLP